MNSQLLQVACVAVCFLQFGWAVRLWRQGLASNYPNLISYLMVSGLHTLIGMAVYQRYGTGPDAVIYGWFWVLTKPLMWALSLSVVDLIGGGQRYGTGPDAVTAGSGC